ncbi:hypothetical protein BCR34DRAFT_589043 [Clohesyomyces aquaticus]|uniref:Uncharacterized protein n=1 Tax=Clohesyomyces aquaticus TaxID=1231657 RepID=A0A1Y1ZHV2_9PLEO|nr:hypothetical protein BCR34DRAFT_589043 [Clohesyomyces aquaticus]
MTKNYNSAHTKPHPSGGEAMPRDLLVRKASKSSTAVGKRKVTYGGGPGQDPAQLTNTAAKRPKLQNAVTAQVGTQPIPTPNPSCDPASDGSSDRASSSSQGPAASDQSVLPRALTSLTAAIVAGSLTQTQPPQAASAQASQPSLSSCPIDWTIPALGKIAPELKETYLLRAPWSPNAKPFGEVAKLWNKKSGETKSDEGLRKRFKRANRFIYLATGTYFPESTMGLKDLLPKVPTQNSAQPDSPPNFDYDPEPSKRTQYKKPTRFPKTKRYFTEAQAEHVESRKTEKAAIEREDLADRVKIRLFGEVYTIGNKTRMKNSEFYNWIQRELPPALLKKVRHVDEYPGLPLTTIPSPVFFDDGEMDGWIRFPSHEDYGEEEEFYEYGEFDYKEVAGKEEELSAWKQIKKAKKKEQKRIATVKDHLGL